MAVFGGGSHSRSESVSFTSEFDGRVLSIKPLIVCASTRHEITPGTIGPVVSSDGRGYLLVRRHVKHKFCCMPRTGSAAANH